jgi:hypothetical protein
MSVLGVTPRLRVFVITVFQPAIIIADGDSVVGIGDRFLGGRWDGGSRGREEDETGHGKTIHGSSG